MNAAFELVYGEIALASPITTSRGTWTHRRGVILRLRDAEGRVGHGEATPLPGYSPDGVDDCARALERVAREVDPNALHVASRFDEALAGVPCARFALETALVDLASQRAGVSVASVLAGLAGGRALDEVALSALVDLASPEMETRAMDLIQRGVTTVKAKIGTRARDIELAALARLRHAVGPAVRLRLDANGAFDVHGAATLLRDVAPFAPELVEEPTSGEALLALAASPVPWGADESLQDARIADRLLSSACAAFVVKPQLYGLHAGRDLAMRALAAGKGVVVTHLFDGPVALAAACELALSLALPLARPPLACGLDHHASLGLFGEADVPQLVHADRGRVVSHAPGLGVALCK